MDNNESSGSESGSSRLQQLRPQRHPSKMRKKVQKVVVRVKIEENEEESGGKKHRRRRSEGPPSDCWSWRKYGQKPIKGSPYPRGYYRCSTSKGCSAKKQVERSRTDASLLLITYTSSHNHPGPQLHPTSYVDEDEEDPGKQCPETQSIPINKDQKTCLDSKGDCHYSRVNDDEEPLCYPHLFTFKLEEDEEEPLCYPHLLNFSTPKSEENDFYDELEELPQTSSEENDFYDELEELPQTSSFTRNNFFEERILVNPY